MQTHTSNSVPDGVGPWDADSQDNRREQTVGNGRDLRPQSDKRQIEDQKDKIGNEKTADDGPCEGAVR